MVRENRIAVFGLKDELPPEYYGPGGGFGRFLYRCGLNRQIDRMIEPGVTTVLLTGIGGNDEVSIFLDLLLRAPDLPNLKVHAYLPEGIMPDSFTRNEKAIWVTAHQKYSGDYHDIVDNSTQVIVFHDNPDREPAIQYAMERGVPVTRMHPLAVVQDEFEHYRRSSGGDIDEHLDCLIDRCLELCGASLDELFMEAVSDDKGYLDAAVCNEPLTAIIGEIRKPLRNLYSVMEDYIFEEAYLLGLTSLLLEAVRKGCRHFVVGLENYTDYMVATILITLRMARPEDGIRLHCMVPPGKAPKLTPKWKKIWEAADEQHLGTRGEMLKQASHILCLCFHGSDMVGKHQGKHFSVVFPGLLVEDGSAYVDEVKRKQRRKLKKIVHGRLLPQEEREHMEQVIAVYTMDRQAADTFFGNDRSVTSYGHGVFLHLLDIVRAHIVTILTDLSGNDTISLHSLMDGYDNVRLHCILPSEASVCKLEGWRKLLWRYATARSFGSMDDILSSATSLLVSVADPDHHPAVQRARELGIPVTLLDPKDVCERGKEMMMDVAEETVEEFKVKMRNRLDRKGVEIPPWLS